MVNFNLGYRISIWVCFQMRGGRVILSKMKKRGISYWKYDVNAWMEWRGGEGYSNVYIEVKMKNLSILHCKYEVFCLKRESEGGSCNVHTSHPIVSVSTAAHC